MAKNTLNRKNLVALGAEPLADLLLEIITDDAALKRRVRMELSANAGADQIARDIRKRFATLRRAQSYIDWQKQRAFAKELGELVEMVGNKVAPTMPDEAFDLLWSFLQLAPNIYHRTDDSNGTIGMIMDDAMSAIGDLAPRLKAKPKVLAEKIFEALQDNGFGEFDGATTTLAEALKPEGIEHLKKLATDIKSAPLRAEDRKRYEDIFRYSSREVDIDEMAREGRNRTADIILQEVADLQGDVDAWMAKYTAEQLTYHTIAPGVAQRLLKAGRNEEALKIIEGARNQEETIPFLIEDSRLDDTYIECLEALNRKEQLQSFLWESFCQTLNRDHLKRYLKALPDFDDIEAEDKARKIAFEHPDVHRALVFFVKWPDHANAAKLVETRHSEIDGDLYFFLSPAAKDLQGEFPLATTILLRAMILDSLENGRSSRYGHASRHLKTCEAIAPAIANWEGHDDHQTFISSLRTAHGRKSSFWSKLD